MTNVTPFFLATTVPSSAIRISQSSTPAFVVCGHRTRTSNNSQAARGPASWRRPSGWSSRWQSTRRQCSGALVRSRDPNLAQRPVVHRLRVMVAVSSGSIGRTRADQGSVQAASRRAANSSKSGRRNSAALLASRHRSWAVFDGAVLCPPEASSTHAVRLDDSGTGTGRSVAGPEAIANSVEGSPGSIVIDSMFCRSGLA